MQQPTKQFQQPEDWANFLGAELVTSGMSRFFHSLMRLFIKLMASISLVFLRARTGTRFISVGTLVWGWILMGVFWFLEAIFNTEMSMVSGTGWNPGSIGLIWTHMLAFAGFAIYRIIEARRNLRSNEGEQRFSEEPGYSVILPVIGRLLSRLGVLDARRLEDDAWYRLEYRFQKFGEPALVFLTGLLVSALGFGVYGFMLMASGLSCLFLFLLWEEAYFRHRQEQWDARLMSSLVSEVDQPIRREKGLIIQQNLMRSHDNGFRQWQEAQEEQPQFETAAHGVSGNGIHAEASH